MKIKTARKYYKLLRFIFPNNHSPITMEEEFGYWD